nr:MAG TPA: nucelotide kinase [Caudoviricetes sp.]
MSPIIGDLSTKQSMTCPSLETLSGSLAKASEAQEMSELRKEHVNHPDHYKTGKFECIDIMVETQGVESTQDFCICNAFKYLYRHKKKNGSEDISKAIWYLNKYLELEKEKNHENV